MGNQFHLTRRGRLLTLIVGAAILGLFILAIISGVIQKWLWMQQLNYAGVVWPKSRDGKAGRQEHEKQSFEAIGNGRSIHLA